MKSLEIACIKSKHLVKMLLNQSNLQNLLDGLGGERRINYSLERFTEALTSVGNPEQNVYSLVISGTNGKGTTALLISSALVHEGHQVVTYLSPHLQHPSERLLLNLSPIDESELTELATEFYSVAQKFSLSYFEYLTLLNFIWANRRGADFLVLEVGLGGRLDATNVTSPLACALTNVNWDHMDYLGNSLESILSEKMGILRQESLLFTGVSDPKLRKSIEARCEALDSIYYYSKEQTQQVVSRDWSGQSLFINGHPFSLTNPTVGATDNAMLALLLLRIVFPKMPLSTIRKAFASLKTPGRMEVIQTNPRVILSGDHNPAGLDCLKDSLKALANEGRLRILCAFSPDKPYREMLNTLHDLSDDVVLTQTLRKGNSLPPGYTDVTSFEPNPKKAIDSMMKAASVEDTILVTGSLYLVGELRSLWQSKVEFLNGPSLARAKTAEASDVPNPAKSRPKELVQNLSP